MTTATPEKFSLIEHLIGDSTQAKFDKYGATKLVRLAIKILGYDALKAKSQLASRYKLVQLARDIVVEIETTIQQIEGLSDADEEQAWTLYEQYVTKLVELEKRLRLIHSKFPEAFQTDNLAPADINECNTAINLWVDSRTDLKTQLEALQKVKDQNAQSNASTEQQLDDLALLQSLLAEVQTKESSWKNYRPKASITWILKKLNEEYLAKFDMKNSVHTEGLEYAVKSVWLIHGVVHLVGNSTSDDTKSHMQTKQVWEAAVGVVKQLIDQNPTTEKIQTAYDAFVEALKIVTDPGSFHYFKLIKASIQIARPWYHRNKLLIKYISGIIRGFNAEVDMVEKSKHKPLIDEAFNAVEASITTTTAACPFLFTGLQLDDEKQKAALAKLNEAKDKLKAAYDKYPDKDNGNNKPFNFDNDLITATTADNDDWAELQALCKATTSLSSGASATEVKVSFKKKDGTTVAVDFPDNTKLQAVLVRASDESTKYIGATLTGKPEKVWLNLGKELKDLAANGALNVDLHTSA